MILNLFFFYISTGVLLMIDPYDIIANPRHSCFIMPDEGHDVDIINFELHTAQKALHAINKAVWTPSVPSPRAGRIRTTPISVLSICFFHVD